LEENEKLRGEKAELKAQLEKAEKEKGSMEEKLKKQTPTSTPQSPATPEADSN